jgi:hypothetical protein
LRCATRITAIIGRSLRTGAAPGAGLRRLSLCALTLWVATEKRGKAGEEATLALLALLRHRALLQFLHLLLQLADASSGGLKALFLQDDGLGEIIGGIRVTGEFVADQRFGFGIARRRCGLAHADEKFIEQLAFLGRHDRFLHLLAKHRVTAEVRSTYEGFEAGRD